MIPPPPGVIDPSRCTEALTLSKNVQQDVNKIIGKQRKGLLFVSRGESQTTTGLPLLVSLLSAQEA